LNPFKFRFRRKEEKQSRAFGAILSTTLGQPVWSPGGYASFVREGYKKNVYVYACVRLISMACAGIPWLVYQMQKGKLEELPPEHPLASLFVRPNPWQGWSRFIEEVVGYLLLSGNAYIEMVGPEGKPPRELYALRPDRVRIVPGNPIQPVAGYIYSVGGHEVRFKAEDVLHLKFFNPLDDFYGMPPIEAAAYSVDQNNESRAWNVALLQNSARPPGAFVIPPQERLSEEEFERLREQVRELYQGGRNAGKPLLLEGGLDWKPMGYSPADMDWLEGIKLSAREIALAYGVPPQLIGDRESSTYANYQEARKAFYTETVLPLMDWLKDEFNARLVPKFGKDMFVDYDRDEIEALQEDREAMWDRVIRAVERGVLTPNEARELLGYKPVPGGDSLFMPGNLLPYSSIEGEE